MDEQRLRVKKKEQYMKKVKADGGVLQAVVGQIDTITHFFFISKALLRHRHIHLFAHSLWLLLLHAAE